ncbi:fimbrial protein [Rouxiella sp. Mn2063]|uniref:fimbrial protein n=1 Tax=Rouxiella sp. Mn2063 TaxID=3395262 RepID=UPI003BE3DE0E
MNKRCRILCLFALLSGGGQVATAATVTVTGQVLDNTCEVDVGSKNFTVNLGASPSKQFSRVGDPSPAVRFSIVFLRCDASAQKVKVGFTGTADSNNASLLKIDALSGSASGIGVQILDSGLKAIPLNAAQSELNWNNVTAGQRNVLTFYSRMMATQTPVSAGTVSATATFTLEYF